MFNALFGALGSLIATGPGILLLAALAGSIILFWDWRLAVGGVVALQVGTVAMLTYLHDASGILMAGQMLAILLAAIMLGGSNYVRGAVASPRQGSNWLIRLIALFFVTIAWWFVDPGFTFPSFSQPETDLFVWVALCGLLMLCLGDHPLFVATALFMWLTASYAVATVLLPGSGIPVLLGMVTLLVALACSYLLLAEPGDATLRRQRTNSLLSSLGRRWRARLSDGQKSDHGTLAPVNSSIAGPSEQSMPAERSA